MLKRLKSVSMMLFLMGASTGAAYAAANPGVADVKITQQSGSCTGVVIDAAGETVIGASVVVKGTTNGTITGIDGDFALSNVSKGAVIQVSFVGYITQEVKFNGQPMKITLQEDTQTLEEVVVTGYGGIQKAKTMTAAAVNVKLGNIAKLPVTSVSDGLGGRVAGVITQGRSGAPGEVSKIWIRGGSNILYVIDGVVMETAQGEVYFNRLRPDDIASMSILKDASATSVYGPRANDGVVVVETKKGQSGNVEITYNQKFTVMTPSYRMDPMDVWSYVNKKNALYAANMEEHPAYNATEMSKFYMGYLNQQGYDRQQILDMVNQKYNLGYTSQDIADLFNPFVTQGGDIENYYQSYDPWEWFNHTQPMIQSNISVRGGGERVKYYTSLGYMDQQGISDTYGYKQYNAIVNTEALLLKDKSLKFTLNLNGIKADKNQPYAGDGVFNSTLVENGDYINKPENWTTGLMRSGGLDARLNTGFNNTDDYRMQLSMGLKWSLPWVEGLAVSANVNYNHSYSMNKQFNHPQVGVYGSPYATSENTFNPDDASVRQEWNNYSLTTGIFQVDYNKSFGKHNISAMVNYQSQVRNTNNTWVSAKGYPTVYTPQIDHGATQTGKGGTETNWGSASWIGRVSYDYAGKYLFQLSGNYNGSLSYHPDKRWGLFYAASAGWVMTEESFIKEILNPDIFTMLKLRGGYGVVGKENADPYSYMNQYAMADGRLLLGENMSSTTAWREKLVSSNLTWGESQQFSLGFDFELFKGKLSGSFDTYLYRNKKDAMDMNPKLTYTPVLGLPNTPQTNAPFVTRHRGGYEFAVNWKDGFGDFDYRVGLNFTHWDEVYIKHTSEDTDFYYPHLDYLGKTAQQPVYNAHWTTSGLFTNWQDMYNSYLHFNRNHTLGTFRMNDLNGDGVLGIGDYMWNERAGTTPQTIYGINLGASYKDFSIDIFLQGATDVTGDVPSPGRSQQDYYWNYGKYMWDDSYMPDDPDGDKALPLPTNANRGWGYNYVDRWVYDASYLKLKNISLRYDLKRTVLKNVTSIKGLELNFIVNNVYTWVKKDNPLKNMTDPEYIPANSIWGGNKLGSYPTQRSYTLSAILTL